jgi:peptidoglycan/xylan/chitin deacetylase (PgdA/CDA1 family)
MPQPFARLADGSTLFANLIKAMATAILAVFCTAQAGAETVQGNQCWSESALAYRQGDQLIRKNVAEAIVRPPHGQGVAPGPSLTENGAIRRVELPPGSKKLIAITFDLCEQPHEISGYQGDIVDLLRAQHVKATFFAGGKWLLTHSERAEQLMSDPLFEIGNHSWEHRNLRVVSDPVMAQEISAPELAYQNLRKDLTLKRCSRPRDRVLASQRAPEAIKLFRFPYGACDPRSLQAVAGAGLTAIQWDVSAGDPWPGTTAPLMVKAVLSHVRPGSIVIFHANGRGWHTPSALPEIVAKLRERGYEFVTVSELLQAGRPVIESRCYDVKPGDTDRYDKIGRRAEEHHASRVGLHDEAHSSFGEGANFPRSGWTAMPESR